jgi:ElaB/YqjD/DUF883 family membrane-anchored ribosome-binding protein
MDRIDRCGIDRAPIGDGTRTSAEGSVAESAGGGKFEHSTFETELKTRRRPMQERNDLGEGTVSGEAAGTDWAAKQESVTPASAAGRRRGRTRDEAAEAFETAREKAAQAYDSTVSSASRAYRNARGYAQEHPDMAAAVTFAVGMGVGAMMAGRRGGIYRHGLLPVAAVALAKAVLDVFDEA